MRDGFMSVIKSAYFPDDIVQIVAMLVESNYTTGEFCSLTEG